MDPPSAPLNMLTPPASTAAPSTITNLLPKPRRNPVKPGSAKETEVISFLDTQLIAVQRRIDNRKYWSENDAGVERAATGGYTSFKEAEKHVRELVDVVWITGSRRSCRISPLFACPQEVNTEKLHLFSKTSDPISAYPGKHHLGPDSSLPARAARYATYSRAIRCGLFFPPHGP
jgi:hypothetical protein